MMTPPKLQSFTPHRLAALWGALLLAVGCSSTKLQPGGAYAPLVTNTAYAPLVTNTAYAFFVADSAFDLAHAALDAAFTFEYENRAALYRAEPQVKHSLDQLRFQAVVAEQIYARCRAAYLTAPVPANLAALQYALAKAQQLATAATAALPKVPPLPKL